MSDTILEVLNVHKSYGSQNALNGVDLAVRRGELFGLLGPNGAGKTTLLSILAGLTKPSIGQVKLFGEPFVAQSSARRKIGLATQDLAIYPELTAQENLRFFGQLYGMRNPDLQQRTQEMLASVGLLERANRRAGTFSGGMKRRLNLAVALIHRPEILLLDEPTTGVDPQSRNHIFDQVRQANANGLTVIYTSHYMEEVETLCPRLAILDGGQVRACDTLPNLLKQLDSVVKLQLVSPTAAIRDAASQLNSAKEVRLDDHGWLTVTSSDLAPLLPKLLPICGEIAEIQLDQPSLERVFLVLTGRELRD